VQTPPGDVDSQLQAAPVDVREALARERRVEVRDVDVDVLVPGTFEFAVDGARNDVARRQIGHFVVAAHEGIARARAQPAAFAAHRLGDQERALLGVEEARRMKLHELHVGERGARAVRHGHPVSGRDVRIRRVQVDLPDPARGQEGDGRQDALHAPGLDIERVGAEAAFRAG
jgi:hypothetical protein